MAEDLSAAIRACPGPPSPVIVDVMEVPMPAPPQPNVPVQPPGSRCLLEPCGLGFRLRVPADGLRGQARPLLLFAAVWLALVVFADQRSGATLLDYRALAAGRVNLLLAVFAVLGLTFLLMGIHLAMRRALLVVDAGRLTLVQDGLLGRRRREWHRDELAALRVEPTGAEAAGKPMLELRLTLRSGRGIHLFPGRDAGELHWMATRLRHSLGLPPRDGASLMDSARDLAV